MSSTSATHRSDTLSRLNAAAVLLAARLAALCAALATRASSSSSVWGTPGAAPAAPFCRCCVNAPRSRIDRSRHVSARNDVTWLTELKTGVAKGKTRQPVSFPIVFSIHIIRGRPPPPTAALSQPAAPVAAPSQRRAHCRSCPPACVPASPGWLPSPAQPPSGCAPASRPALRRW